MTSPGVGPDGSRSVPTVSVLVLAYNHASYLERTLQSIVAQDLDEPIEIIIGEDASTDETLDIAMAFAARNPNVVRVLPASENLGMHRNHERVVRAARGEFVAYCEGDDYWTSPSKLRHQLAVLRDDREAVGVHTDFDHLALVRGHWRARTSYATRVRRVRGARTTFEDLLRRNLVQTCTLLARTEAVLAYLDSDYGRERFDVIDWPLCLYLTRSGAPLAFLATSTAVYRRAPGSVTNSGPEAGRRRIEDQRRMLARSGRLLDGPNEAVTDGVETTNVALIVHGLVHADPDALLSASAGLRRSRNRTRRLLGSLSATFAHRPLPLRVARTSLHWALLARDHVHYRGRAM